MVRIVELDEREVDNLESSNKTALSKMIKALLAQQEPDTTKEEDWIRLLAAIPMFATMTNTIPLKEDLTNRDSIIDTWKAARVSMKNLSVPKEFIPLEASVVEKRGRCDLYELGENFDISNPFYWEEAPSQDSTGYGHKLCTAAQFATLPYVIAAGFGYKSWEADDPKVFRISCPSKKGVVFEIRPKSN